jgi:antitoxin component of MazEF toxin-antitoxin module
MSQTQTKTNREITKIWLHNNISASLIIPVEIARKHNLTKGNHVVVEDTDQGILIRKLDIDKGKAI